MIQQKKTAWTTGIWLGLIGLIHTFFGFAAGVVGVPSGPASGRSPLAEIYQRGIFASIEPDILLGLWFWFVWFGFATLIAALALHKLEKATGTLDTSLHVSILALGISGVVFMPLSGFWLVVILGGIKLIQNRRVTLPMKEAMG